MSKSTTYLIFDATTHEKLGEAKGRGGLISNSANALNLDTSHLPSVDWTNIEILHDNEDLGIGGFGLSDGSLSAEGGFQDRYIVIEERYLDLKA